MNIKTLALISVSALLFACSKTPAPADTAAAPATPAAAPAAGGVATPSADSPQPTRAATYNPKLAPTEIVWDSPEKKKAWEERQRQIKQSQKAHP